MLNNIKAMWQVMHDIKLSSNKKEQLVKKRLERVLVLAYRHVPYYRNMMKNIGYNPITDYKGPEDLIRFPITTKKDIKANDSAMFLKEGIDFKKLYATSTSGSTGIPLKIFLSRNELSFRKAKWLRVLFINKYSIKDKVLALTSPATLEESKTVLQKFGLLRRLAVNHLLPIDKLVEIFTNYKPHVLYGSRSILDQFALELIKRTIKPEGLNLIIVGTEIIYKHNKKLYNQAFGVDPIEYYGSMEMGVMAFETPARDGLYLCDDLTYFEFLDKKSNPALPGEPAKIIVTDLFGTTMPFIRYEQGDIVTIKVTKDPEGKTEKRISKIIGRDNDYIILPDGTKKTYHHLYDDIERRFGEIWQFQFIQKTISYYQVKIAAKEAYFDKIKNQFIDFLYTKFPKNCRFELLRVDFIEPDPGGKIRTIISEIKDDY